MPEFTLQDLRRLYMINSLFPDSSWEWKKVCYDTSATAYNSGIRSTSSLKSYWNIHHGLWENPHIMVDPPSSIPTDTLEAPRSYHEQNSPSDQGLGSLHGTQTQQGQHNASISQHSGSYARQGQAQLKSPAPEYSTSYPELLQGQIQQDQQNGSTARFPANSTYNQYPIRPAPTTGGPSFAGTTHGNPQLLNSPSGWVVNPGDNVSVSAGQQDVASYCSAGPAFNTYVTCNPNLLFAPQATRFQDSQPCFLGQGSEENLTNHEVDVENNVADDESTEGDSDTSFEDNH